MKATGPLFKWFGAKWNASKHYPSPKYDTVIEPYAGSACYSLRYSPSKVIIYDNDPNLGILWPWLIKTATESLIREIPLGLPIGSDIRKLGLTEGQAQLLKHWQRTNNVGDCWVISPWGHLPGQWTANTRARVAEEVQCVKSWTFEKPKWSLKGATYFVDPPYLYNYRYRLGKQFDHKALAAEIQCLKGSEAIVCEAICPKTQAVPTYLPFEFFRSTVTSRRKAEQSHHSKELIYLRSS